MHAIHIYQESARPGCVSNLINRSLYQTSSSAEHKSTYLYLLPNILPADLFQLTAGSRLHFPPARWNKSHEPLITSFYISSCGNLQTKTMIHAVNSTAADVPHISQTKLIGSITSHGVKGAIASATNCSRKEKKRAAKTKNRWVSTERNDGTAMGAVCDWSITSPSKPFFSLRHVQSVDKRHHPTDSLINCEMYSYLLLSYSRAPKTPPLPASFVSFPLPVCKEKKQTGLHKDSFLKKKRGRIAGLAHFLFQDFTPFQSHPCAHNLVHTCTRTQGTSTKTHSVFKHRMQGHGDKSSAPTTLQMVCRALKLCGWALCSTHTDTCPTHCCLRSLNYAHADR